MRKPTNEKMIVGAMTAAFVESTRAFQFACAQQHPALDETWAAFALIQACFAKLDDVSDPDKRQGLALALASLTLSHVGLKPADLWRYKPDEEHMQ